MGRDLNVSNRNNDSHLFRYIPLTPTKQTSARLLPKVVYRVLMILVFLKTAFIMFSG